MLYNVYNPVAFEIFGLTIRWYALFITLGMVAAIFFAMRFVKYRKGLKSDNILDIAIWTIPFGVLGARVFSVLTDPRQPNTIAQIFDFAGGGLSIIGAIIGGGLALCAVCSIKKINPLKLMDVIVPCVLLAQAIGRWGNFANQEVYGLQVAESMQWFPFAVFIERGGLNEWRQALFFYEFLWNVLGFGLLYIILKKVKKEGIVACGYFFWYGLGRSIMEGMRDPEFNLGINTMVSRVFSIGMMILGAAGIAALLYLEKRKKDLSAETAGNAAGRHEETFSKPAEKSAETAAEPARLIQTAETPEAEVSHESGTDMRSIQEEHEGAEISGTESVAEAVPQEPQIQKRAEQPKIRLTEEVIIPKNFVPEVRIVDQDEIDRLSAELDAIEKTYIRTRQYTPPVKPVVKIKTAERPKTASKTAKPAAKTGAKKPAAPAAKTSGTASKATKPAVKPPAKTAQSKKPSTTKGGKKDE